MDFCFFFNKKKKGFNRDENLLLNLQKLINIDTYGMNMRMVETNL